METLRKKVAGAQRRLNVEIFLKWLPWCLFVGLLAATVVMGVDRFRPLGVELWVWPATAVGAAFFVALIGTWWKHRDRLSAAIELDRRFGLRERVSTCLALGPENLASQAGQAVLRDAQRHAARLDVADRFGVRLSRWAALPLVPAAAVLAIALFVEPFSAGNQAKASPVVGKTQVKKSTAKLKNQMQDRRRLAEEQGLREAQDLLQKMEATTSEMSKGDLDKKDALVKMNDLAKQLEERRQQLAGSEKLQDQLQGLKALDKGPADKFADALRNGEFDKAMNELADLKSKLSAGSLSSEDQQQLAKQLAQVGEKLKAMIHEAEAAKEAMREQIHQLRQEGKADEADALEKKLNQLEQANPQLRKLEELAQKMGQSAEQLSQQDLAKAMEQLDSAAKDLQQLQKQAAEAKMLKEALDELANAKSAMVCPHCDGEGCKECQGDQLSEGEGSQLSMSRRNAPGQGRGRGAGPRPEEADETGFYDSKVRGKVGRGSAVITDFVDGPNARGRVEQEINAQFDEVRGGQTDPVTEQPLPRGYREHAQTYFNSLRGGK